MILITPTRGAESTRVRKRPLGENFENFPRLWGNFWKIFFPCRKNFTFFQMNISLFIYCDVVSTNSGNFPLSLFSVCWNFLYCCIFLHSLVIFFHSWYIPFRCMGIFLSFCGIFHHVTIYIYMWSFLSLVSWLFLSIPSILSPISHRSCLVISLFFHVFNKLNIFIFRFLLIEHQDVTRCEAENIDYREIDNS